MATKTVPGGKPDPTPLKPREAALATVLAAIVDLAQEQLNLLHLGSVNTEDADAMCVMVAAEQMARTIGALADRAGVAAGAGSKMRDGDDWCFTDGARLALETLEGREEAAAT